MNNKKIVLIVGFVLVAVTVGVFLLSKNKNVEAGALDGFAQCLAEKSVTMYGAAWCPHCKNEKKLFGSSWKYVPYVECPENINLCLEKGIKGYPTLILGDGTKLEGEQGLQRLSDATSCPLPKSE